MALAGTSTAANPAWPMSSATASIMPVRIPDAHRLCEPSRNVVSMIRTSLFIATHLGRTVWKAGVDPRWPTSGVGRARRRQLHAQELRRVMQQDLGAHLVLDRQLGELPQPARGRKHGEVRAEEHLVLDECVVVLNDRRREVLGRPAREVPI